ncbi:FxLD family lanthipeptide [Streptomyces sp. Cmuel-A718b]|uniref:FxLD family lanthipeptide n=1 Tax=Streptomyces sp. Cmuel-A718b TaxID=697328 RepID=UPI00081F0FD8|nr:FxLD family lanthipeptide [Streptomyces sp. Cmuel-A718b]SCF59056.1 FxLD family lantipeptide [Streptomyces sp. Cmuel-A718b]
MTRIVTKSTTQVQESTAGGQSDGFDLNVSLLEVSDTAGLTVLTDDGCGSSCGACVTFTD